MNNSTINGQQQPHTLFVKRGIELTRLAAKTGQHSIFTKRNGEGKEEVYVEIEQREVKDFQVGGLEQHHPRIQCFERHILKVKPEHEGQAITSGIEPGWLEPTQSGFRTYLASDGERRGEFPLKTMALELLLEQIVPIGTFVPLTPEARAFWADGGWREANQHWAMTATIEEHEQIGRDGGFKLLFWNFSRQHGPQFRLQAGVRMGSQNPRIDMDEIDWGTLIDTVRNASLN